MIHSKIAYIYLVGGPIRIPLTESIAESFIQSLVEASKKEQEKPGVFWHWDATNGKIRIRVACILGYSLWDNVAPPASSSDKMLKLLERLVESDDDEPWKKE